MSHSAWLFLVRGAQTIVFELFSDGQTCFRRQALSKENVSAPRTILTSISFTDFSMGPFSSKKHDKAVVFERKKTGPHRLL